MTLDPSDDDAFREWIQRQRSCVSGNFSEYLETTGEGRCIAAHVRRANTSGMRYKAKLCCVPLTFDEHTRFQHQKGESALGGKAFFDEALEHYRKKWLEHCARVNGNKLSEVSA